MVNFIHPALLFNCMKSFYIVLSQPFVPRSGTMFLSVFVVLYFVFLWVNFFTYNCSNLLFVILF